MSEHKREGRVLSHGELVQLARWNTPTVYNGWEQITRRDAARECFSLEETHDFMPDMGAMAGYAVTLVVEPSNPEHVEATRWDEYYRYVADTPEPKIVVVQDLDKPQTVGAPWGEVMTTTHRAFGCVGVILDGAIRDVDAMTALGFKAIARRLAVGHGHTCPVRWGCDVEVFGTPVRHGDLVHADEHGFLVIPEEDQAGLLDAVRFMDAIERDTKIAALRAVEGLSADEIFEKMQQSVRAWQAAINDRLA